MAQDAGRGPRDRMLRRHDVAELLILVSERAGFEPAMPGRAFEACCEVAPVAGGEHRAFPVVRAGRNDGRALLQQQRAHGVQAREVFRRAGPDDHQQRVRLAPGCADDLHGPGLGELADDIRQHDQVVRRETMHLADVAGHRRRGAGARFRLGRREALADRGERRVVLDAGDRVEREGLRSCPGRGAGTGAKIE